MTYRLFQVYRHKTITDPHDDVAQFQEVFSFQKDPFNW